MECDFIVESGDSAERPALSGWETVVFELDDDPAYFSSDCSTASIAP
jgi:hypothetical protein